MGLSASEFSEVLPWSLVLDEDFCVAVVGASLEKHAKVIQPGIPFSQHMHMMQPDRTLVDAEDLKQFLDRLILVQVDGLPIPLRGSIKSIGEGGQYIFAASPLVRSPSELAAGGLSISDFPEHDAIPDLLFALQARDVAMREAEESSERREEARGRLKSILDSALDAMITINLKGVVVEFNDVASGMFGYPRSEAIGKELSNLIIPPHLRAQHLAGMKHFRNTGEGPILRQRIEVDAMRSDGTEFPVALAVIPFEFSGEKYFTATIRDLTIERAQQKAIEQAAEQEKLLGRELDHRVKNMLAQIVVLCREAESKTTADSGVIAALSARIQNFSAVHELLSRARATGIDLNELVGLCLSPYVSLDGEAVTRSGPNCRIVARAAMTMAMVLNELATNASKYGAFRHGGTLDITWSIARGESPAFVLNWHEVHSGPIPDSLDGGFGHQVLQGVIPHELSGEVSHSLEDGGLFYQATIPLDQLIHSS